MLLYFFKEDLYFKKIYLFERREHERERDSELPSAGSFSKGLQQPELAQDNARSQELHSDNGKQPHSYFFSLILIFAVLVEVIHSNGGVPILTSCHVA